LHILNDHKERKKRKKWRPVYTQCTGGDCEVECHNRSIYPFYSTEAQADYTLAHEVGQIMLNTHNAVKAESKGPEIMKAANNTMTATVEDLQEVVNKLRDELAALHKERQHGE
jgi:hypothetical protein